MQGNQFLALVRQKIGLIVLLGILVAALSFLFLVMSQKNFKVSTDFLVVQNQTTGQDYYSLSRSAEYIGSILSESIRSEAFINEVVKTGKVSNEFLPFDKKKKMDEWNKIVQVKRSSQLAILSINVFGNTQKDVMNISDGIAQVLTQENNLFRGQDQNIEVRILSGPIVEKNPSLTNIVAAIAAGFFVGCLLGFIWFYYRFSLMEENAYSTGINSKGGNTSEMPKLTENIYSEGFSGNRHEPTEEEYQESIRFLDR